MKLGDKWESKPLAKNIEELETRLGISSVIFSPCEMISKGSNQEESDYLSRMNQNIDRLVSVIGRDGTGQWRGIEGLFIDRILRFHLKTPKILRNDKYIFPKLKWQFEYIRI